MNKYCTCVDSPGNFLSRTLCPICNLPKRLIIKPSVDVVVVVTKPKIIQHTVLAVLAEGVNIVTLAEKEYEVHEECLNTRGRQDRYPLDYLAKRIRYNNPMGFEFHDGRYRPFKTGDVKGYIKNDKFYITENVTNKRVAKAV